MADTKDLALEENQGNIVIYQTEDGDTKIDVRFVDETVWLTQQQMADKLGISLRYYQNIETGDRTGDFTLWDMLEDITGIHQRILRELS